MISINKFKTFLDNLKTTVADIDSYIITPTEEHAIKKLNRTTNTGVILLAVMPSGAAKPNVTVDNYSDINTTFLFILEKTNYSDVDDDSELEQYQRLQQITEEIKNYLLNNKEKCEIPNSIDLESLNMDPEYNVFGGYNGWSLSLTINKK